MTHNPAPPQFVQPVYAKMDAVMYGIEEANTDQSSQLCVDNLFFGPRHVEPELLARGGGGGKKET